MYTSSIIIAAICASVLTRGDSPLALSDQLHWLAGLCAKVLRKSTLVGGDSEGFLTVKSVRIEMCQRGDVMHLIKSAAKSF